MEDRLRQLVRETADAEPRIGALDESLKWGQPSFTPKRRNVGSSVRIQSNEDRTASLMFICTTDLVARFRDRYGEQLECIGNREVRVRDGDLDDAETRAALAHCVAQALTYKLDRKR